MEQFNKNTYRVDFVKLSRWLIPRDLRKPVMMSLVFTIVSPIMNIYNRFMAYKDFVKYRLIITPQVCYLEKMLNDRYDLTARRIVIKDPMQYPYLYLYLRSEKKPVAVYTKAEHKPRYLYTRAETSRFGVDFVIEIPLAVQYNTNELIALVNNYKLASKKFKIKNV